MLTGHCKSDNFAVRSGAAMTELLVAMGLIAGVVGAHEIGFRLGSLDRLAVLLGAVAISVGLIGFADGRVGRRFSRLNSVYGAVLAVALWMTIDLDYLGIGFIRVSNVPSWKPWLQ